MQSFVLNHCINCATISFKEVLPMIIKIRKAATTVEINEVMMVMLNDPSARSFF